MEILNYTTPFIYFLLVVSWAFILSFYIRKIFVNNINDKLLKTLLLILAIDAFRTLFESSYFGVWFTSYAGIIPIEIYYFLAKPQIVFFPKIINLFTSAIVLFMLIRKWIPAETSRIDNINEIVKKQTAKLTKNVAQLNKIKDELIKSEEKYKSSFEHFPFPIFVWQKTDDNFKMISANRSALLIAKENMESPLIEISSDFWRNNPELYRYLKKCFNTKKTVSIEYRFANKIHKKEKFYLITFNFLPPESVQSIFVDITEQNRNKNELTEQKLLFESMFNTIPDGVLITNTKREILLANKGMKTTFNYAPEGIIGKTTEFLYADQEKYNNAGANIFDKIAVSYNNFYLTNYKKRNEIVFPGETFGTKLYDKKGKWIGNLGIMRDVSERINYINEINEAKIKAEQSDRLKSAFLANMSHEIRTPLNSILGFSTLLGDQDTTNNDKQRFIKIIQDNGKQLMSIISDIIDISKIESNQLDINKVSTNINEELDKMYEEIKQKLYQIKSPVKLSINYALVKNEAIFMTDQFRFRQIFLNLLGNAVKFTKQGAISFGYEVVNENIRFFVKDTGKGISSSDQKKLFKRFSQIESKEKSELVSGSGLGLAISKALSELLGGKMWVESNQKLGSTFYFELPFIKDLNKRVYPVYQQEQVSRNFNFAGKTILIVDNETSCILLLETLLKREDILTFGANNGLEAIEIIQKNENVDLVLIDLQMPKMNGYEATRKIKLLRPTLPVIAQTALAQVGDQEKAIEAGCDNFINKPINKVALFNLLMKYLNPS